MEEGVNESVFNSLNQLFSKMFSSIDKSIITCKVRTMYGHISHKRVCVLFVLIEMENFIQNEIMIAYIFRNNINIV